LLHGLELVSANVPFPFDVQETLSPGPFWDLAENVMSKVIKTSTCKRGMTWILIIRSSTLPLNDKAIRFGPRLARSFQDLTLNVNEEEIAGCLAMTGIAVHV